MTPSLVAIITRRIIRGCVFIVCFSRLSGRALLRVEHSLSKDHAKENQTKLSLA